MVEKVDKGWIIFIIIILIIFAWTLGYHMDIKHIDNNMFIVVGIETNNKDETTYELKFKDGSSKREYDSFYLKDKTNLYNIGDTLRLNK